MDMEKLKEILLKAKKMGFSDKQIANLLGMDEMEVRELRKKLNIIPLYKMVDTCAAEFEAKTPYYYSAYETFVYKEQDESNPSDRKKVIIIGSGPIRIGQGIEFDYSSVHAVLALKEMGIEAIIINNNPETVSTDYDTSDKLYFEPITFEDVLNIAEREKERGELLGVIVQFGGQTAINLAMKLKKAGVNILGTTPENINVAEDREEFSKLLKKLNIPQAEGGTAFTKEEALEIAKRIGYPVLVRPSYVLGGRAMQIVYSEDELIEYMEEAVRVSEEHPVLIDKFLEDAVELDVDAVCDGESVLIGAIMEHIEEAGVHSGDSATVIPPQTLPKEIIDTVIDYTAKLARALNIVGLLNVQYAVKDGVVYVLEANPRASRTVPYVSKSVGIPLAKLATKIMLGKKLEELIKDYDVDEVAEKVWIAKPKYVSIKEAVFPFQKLPGVDPVLGPEMKSTGEAIGIDKDFGRAYYKAQLSANMELPIVGNVFISVRDRDKKQVVEVAKKLHELGFTIYATEGTAKVLRENGIPAILVKKISESTNDNILKLMREGKIHLIINTSSGKKAKSDGYYIRRAAVDLGIPYITTIPGAKAAVKAIEAVKTGELNVYSLDELDASIKNRF
ncbi:carbamoyl-phosphate synthase, large subunit [Methanocaldococcus bathoardescens]|uniref:Carbamoyl phosphate synthase large chain, C-terminal section n=1 Tax=Methanocaldococcus bathoardescens TaxID=1301915 RepID=A0A076LFL5_9EURY|nr:carbamoyl-phosphate synthase large subunit [Methanocaldococcus bathoardescens]AIJ05248.1 carbamoyl-phosphate synthase, large subunit [Methanocaldococcus bathoardescens]